MTKESFKAQFKKFIEPFITELDQNNSLISQNDLNTCVSKAYDEYNSLMKQYKDHVSQSPDNCILDRHRVASCICGAFLKSPAFTTDKLKKLHQKDEIPVEAIFYYANEMVAFHAACFYLSIFMVNDNLENKSLCYDIFHTFPDIPETSRIKKGFLDCVLFNLAQISDMKQIGLKHYDVYAYAMFFFDLEQIFYYRRGLIDKLKLGSVGRV